MTVQKKIKSHLDVINYFKELLFHNTYIEKPKIKHLKKIDLLSELTFYEELCVAKTNKTFRGYAMTDKVELIDKNDPLSQLEASKSNIKKYLFHDLLKETKGFKYQITLRVELKNNSQKRWNFFLFIFIQQQKVINHKFDLDKSS